MCRMWSMADGHISLIRAYRFVQLGKSYFPVIRPPKEIESFHGLYLTRQLLLANSQPDRYVCTVCSVQVGFFHPFLLSFILSPISDWSSNFRLVTRKKKRRTSSFEDVTSPDTQVSYNSRDTRIPQIFIIHGQMVSAVLTWGREGLVLWEVRFRNIRIFHENISCRNEDPRVTFERAIAWWNRWFADPRMYLWERIFRRIHIYVKKNLFFNRS